MMNQTTVKSWKTTPVPVHTAYCNFKHKFAIKNSQIATQKIILLSKFFNEIVPPRIATNKKLAAILN